MTHPLDPTLRDRLARIHTGSLCDALGSIGALGAAVRPITPGARLVGTNRRVGFTQIPIASAGVPVHPDDVVVAAADGVVIIPREQTAVVAERAEGIVRRDEGFIRQIGEGKLLVDLLQFRELFVGSK